MNDSYVEQVQPRRVSVNDPIDVNVVTGGSVSNFTVLLDQVTSTVAYIGKAQPGTATSSPNWQITKLDTSSGVSLTWADGNADFDNVWDNRAALTYTT